MLPFSSGCPMLLALSTTHPEMTRMRNCCSRVRGMREVRGRMSAAPNPTRQRPRPKGTADHNCLVDSDGCGIMALIQCILLARINCVSKKVQSLLTPM
ncbi:uncharacterized protein BO96DRAFT_14651 [Aspergillus niger CBS 101883]|uniref:Uncharacterized protein n=1 Tax=Aspergillus phoenicis ATCC 13157 TaxID=1353007 RepID=A0A370P7I3_ASPPH|nr:uncharacterized protein BO96DRAFT_14651 [Aspergillus niger CBS 101883]PYH62519.1 hypothetical protein BO96DRAFT_14651 [Aspergillus niger CBS 101883]RDK38122.1 hypothetical protein M752DRAFT_81438 [Aspergillus phoenicis ATCC 13157]